MQAVHIVHHQYDTRRGAHYQAHRAETQHPVPQQVPVNDMRHAEQQVRQRHHQQHRQVPLPVAPDARKGVLPYADGRKHQKRHADADYAARQRVAPRLDQHVRKPVHHQAYHQREKSPHERPAPRQYLPLIIVVHSAHFLSCGCIIARARHIVKYILHLQSKRSRP